MNEQERAALMADPESAKRLLERDRLYLLMIETRPAWPRYKRAEDCEAWQRYDQIKQQLRAAERENLADLRRLYYLDHDEASERLTQAGFIRVAEQNHDGSDNLTFVYPATGYKVDIEKVVWTWENGPRHLNPVCARVDRHNCVLVGQALKHIQNDKESLGDSRSA